MGTEAVTLAWDAGEWLNEPAATERVEGDLVVTAIEGSDLWRTTAYGVVYDSGHALLHALEPGAATEVTFLLDYGQQFDQAGVLLRSTETTWIKAGVEVSDGVAQVGAVVTHGLSDWSVAPVPHWDDAMVTVRVSRGDDAVTIRARRGDDPWQLVRVAPWPGDTPTWAGPYCCSPTRAGLRVRFRNWTTGPADGSLH